VLGLSIDSLKCPIADVELDKFTCHDFMCYGT